MKSITEKDNEHQKWYVEAKTINLDTLPEFITKLTTEYNHDYGTICHAIAASAIAAAWAAESTPQGGITGFQAGAVLWSFIRNWMYSDNKVGLRIINYDNLLYPQYEDSFTIKVDEKTWKNVQEEARKLLEGTITAHPDVVYHWESIVKGIVPFGLTVVKERQE